MSKHAAKTSFETRIVEGAFNALFGGNTPDRDGRHRDNYLEVPELDEAKAAA